MDGKNLQFDFENSDFERMRGVLHRMGEFVALFESAEAKMRSREEALERLLQESESHFNVNIDKIRSLLNEMETIMTEAGVARWRIAAESSLKEGERHYQSIQKVTEEFRQLSYDTCERLDRATSYTVKGISESINSFRAADFKKLTVESAEHVQHAVHMAVEEIARVGKSFYWKKLFLIFIGSILIAFTVGLYLTDEWPWEIHKDVMDERKAGDALIQAWTQLSESDKAIILTHAKHKVV